MQTVLHSVAVFAFLWLIVRVVGKRELSQLSAFDFILLVVLGDLVAEGIIGEDTSVVGAVVAVATFALLTVLMSWASWRFPKSSSIFEGLPCVVIKDGKPVEETLRTERLTVADLREAARAHGIRSLTDVEIAVLEQDGNFSFFERRQKS